MADPAIFTQTLAARWWGDVALAASGRNHWQTRTAYYRAISDLIGQDYPTPFAWHEVVEAVPGGGSRTTFYDIAGRQARGRLLRRYAAAGSVDSTQIALCYERETAVERLVDEAKVWSFWPHRQQWLAELQDHNAAASLEAVVTQWARQNHALASFLDHAPPVCAVEDLTLARDGGLAAVRAFEQLAAAVATATGGGSPPPPASLFAERGARMAVRQRDFATLRPQQTVFA